MLFSFALTGLMLGLLSLYFVHAVMQNHFGQALGWLFVMITAVLGGVGVYIGRFLRWNSWDVFFSPKEILSDVVVRVVNPLSNLNFYGFTSIITAFLVISYLMFISMRRDSKFGS